MANLMPLLEGYVAKGIKESSPLHDDVEYMIGPGMIPVQTAQGEMTMMIVTIVGLSIPSLALGERISGGGYIPSGCPTEQQVIDTVKSSLTGLTQQRMNQMQQTMGHDHPHEDSFVEGKLVLGRD